MDKKKKIIFDWLNEMYGSCTLHKHNDYPNSIFFKKDNVILGEKDEKNKYFWVSYDEVWNYIEKIFTMGSEEVRLILKEWLNNNEIKSVSYVWYNSDEFNSELSPNFTFVFNAELSPVPLTGPLSRALDDKDKLLDYTVMPVNSYIFGFDGFTPIYDTITNTKLINKIISNES